MLGAGLITLGLSWLLFGSGLFVAWTPLPLFYWTWARGLRAGFILSGLAVLGLAGIYLLFLLKWGGVATAFSWPASTLRATYGVRAVLVFGVAYFIYFVGVGFLLAYGEAKRWSIERSVGFAWLVPLLLMFALMWGGTALAGYTLFGEVKLYVEKIVAQLLQLSSPAGLSERELQFLRANRELFVEQIYQLLPAAAVIAALMTVWGTIIAVRWWVPTGLNVNAQARPFAHWPRLAAWRAPESWVWAPIAAGILYFAAFYFQGPQLYVLIAVNALWILGALYFLQGLAIVAFYLQRQPSFMLRASVYGLLLFFFQVLTPLLVVLGVADVWFNFRKLGVATPLSK